MRAPQAAWVGLRTDIRKALKLEFIEAIIDRKDNLIVYSIKTFRPNGEQFMMMYDDDDHENVMMLKVMMVVK